ncbi:hypothetical protein [Paraburkholderia sp.]|uniref:hypothetical protein n=1 Tax=Paraburkholderia sp. TaxID=1926495 RepID=UPI00286EFDE3|nr:hypothetical protein [Paraburkholderia sp.]
MNTFAFNLKDNVAITVSGETGIVIARAEYAASENQYLVRYQSADGRGVEAWWGQTALSAA